MIIYYDEKQSDFGTTLITHTQKGICGIAFAINDPNEYFETIFPNIEVRRVYSPQYAQKIIAYLNSGQDLDSIQIDMVYGTEFQKLVWKELAAVPCGKTITYSGLAERIGKPKAVRAVASAMSKNPIAILVPCHRVVPKSGGIGNYRWGKEIKSLLLEREKS